MLLDTLWCTGRPLQLPGPHVRGSEAEKTLCYVHTCAARMVCVCACTCRHIVMHTHNGDKVAHTVSYPAFST